MASQLGSRASNGGPKGHLGVDDHGVAPLQLCIGKYPQRYLEATTGAPRVASQTKTKQNKQGDYSRNMSVFVYGIRFGRLAVVGLPAKTRLQPTTHPFSMWAVM